MAADIIQIEKLELVGTVEQVHRAIRKHFGKADIVRVKNMRCVYTDEPPKPQEADTA